LEVVSYFLKVSVKHDEETLKVHLPYYYLLILDQLKILDLDRHTQEIGIRLADQICLLLHQSDFSEDLNLRNVRANSEWTPNIPDISTMYSERLDLGEAHDHFLSNLRIGKSIFDACRERLLHIAQNLSIFAVDSTNQSFRVSWELLCGLVLWHLDGKDGHTAAKFFDCSIEGTKSTDIFVFRAAVNLLERLIEKSPSFNWQIASHMEIIRKFFGFIDSSLSLEEISALRNSFLAICSIFGDEIIEQEVLELLRLRQLSSDNFALVWSWDLRPLTRPLISTLNPLIGSDSIKVILARNWTITYFTDLARVLRTLLYELLKEPIQITCKQIMRDDVSYDILCYQKHFSYQKVGHILSLIFNVLQLVDVNLSNEHMDLDAYPESSLLKWVDGAKVILVKDVILYVCIWYI
jgi:hypothetical protein